MNTFDKVIFVCNGNTCRRSHQYGKLSANIINKSNMHKPSVIN